MNFSAFRSRLLLPLLAVTLHSATATSAQAEANGLAATVNGRPLTKSEVNETIKIQLRQIELQVTDPAKREEMKAKLRKEALDSLIDRELIMAEYQKLSGGQPIKAQYIEEDIKEFVRTTYNGDYNKFLSELKGFGMTLKKFREVREKMLIVTMMRSHASKDVGIITPEKREKFLKEHPDMFREKDYIKLRSITVSKIGNNPGTTPADQKKLIKEIRQRIIKGADFASEAKTYSSDSHASTGGLWNEGKPMDKSQVSSQFADAIFSVKAGQLSEIIEDGDNYYLFFVEAKQAGKLKPMSEIAPELEKLVQLEERKRLFDQWMNRLRNKANIQKF